MTFKFVIQQSQQTCSHSRSENEENLPEVPTEETETEQLYEDTFVNSMLS